MREVTIDEYSANQRLDKYLMKYMNKAPKSFVYKMLRKKNIKLNSKKALGSEMLANGDCLQIYITDESLDNFMEAKAIVPSKPIEVVYEDENILVVNKPVGLLSHPEDANDTDTVIDRILYYLNQKDEFDISKSSVFTPALCNRLDRNTGGLVICGKNLMAVQTLNLALHDRKIDKYYVALVKGKIEEPGILRGYHYKNHKTNEVMISKTETANSKEIITEYTPVENFKGYTLLEMKLITGKSHQIRAHLKSIGHPIIGDRKYGDLNLNFELRKCGASNQFLHSHKIVFGEKLEGLAYLHRKELFSPLPDKFNKFLDYIRPEPKN